MNRKKFIHQAILFAPGLARPSSLAAWFSMPSLSQKRKFKTQLNGGLIGVKASQLQLNELAIRYGFECVSASSAFLEKYTASQASELVAQMKSKGLLFGLGELPLEFRRSADVFKNVLSMLPARCAALQRVGVTRACTYIMSNHAELTYLQNFKLHTERLKEIAGILEDHGIRLGLEYVGPRSIWAAVRYPFIHTMQELRELIAAIGKPNTGVHLDTAHWFTAGETVETILNCSNAEIIGCDVNDALPGIEPIRDQPGYERRLPAVTGVIDLKAFLSALVKIGYDGFIQAEPFDDALNALEDEPAVQKTAEAMKKTLALIDA